MVHIYQWLSFRTCILDFELNFLSPKLKFILKRNPVVGKRFTCKQQKTYYSQWVHIDWISQSGPLASTGRAARCSHPLQLEPCCWSDRIWIWLNHSVYCFNCGVLEGRNATWMGKTKQDNISLEESFGCVRPRFSFLSLNYVVCCRIRCTCYY